MNDKMLKIFILFSICISAACGNSVLQSEDINTQNVNINQKQQIKTINQNQQKETSELYLIMKKDGCFGECPIYDLTIQSDGKVIFEGKEFTKIIGKAEGKLEKEKIKQLIAEIEKAKFFSLDNAYNDDSNNCPYVISDSKTITLHIKLNGKEKTINHYWGCWENSPVKTNSNGSSVKKENWSPTVFPQQLYNLENRIDEIVGTKRWVGE